MSHHHGMTSQYGIQAMCSKEHDHLQGRYGRIFPDLKDLYTKATELKKLGKIDGPMDGGKADNPNETVPMGFVFLGQFIDHEITLDVTSRLDQKNDPHATENFRTPALDLDNIYGRGPEVNSYLYREGKYLLTGKDGTGYSGQPKALSKNDLVRNSEGTAIIGDPRNDENRIVSQLELAFINFHNEVVAYLEKKGVEHDLFEQANQMVRWHYHWMLINEFLPLMIGKPLVDKILREGRQFYTPSYRAYIPIEFAVAAYRFGHSMAPQKLKIQKSQTHDFELFGQTLGFGFDPITDKKQVVEWPMLFDIDPANPAQRTDKLDTKLAKDLLDLPFITQGESSLATRNLLRGQSFLLPSGEDVAAAIGASTSHMDQISDFLKNNTNGIDLTNGTPLWYYILAEAEAIGREDADGTKPGEGMGLVGGTIVGETLIGLLELDDTSFLNSNRGWVPELGSDSDFTMADLLTFKA